MNGDRREPDSLLLLGSRSDRDELTERIDEALPMPVIGTAEAQLVLARGAALALANNAVEPVVEDDEDPGEDEQPPPGPSWISSHTRLISTIATAGLVVVAVALLAALPRLLAEKYPSPTETPTGPAVSAPPATAHAVPPSIAPPPPPPIQALVAEPSPQAPIPTEAPQSLTVAVPEVELIEDVPASPPIVEQAAVVHEPQAPPPPPPAPSVLSPFFGALP